MSDDLPAGGPPPHVSNMSYDMKDTHNSIFFAAVSTTRMPMIVTDPNLPDNPIVFANPAFMHMTGYSEEELIGRNCRLLQGPETDPETVAQVRQAISERREISVEMLNYKKNGSSFWNGLFVSPVFDELGKLIYYFASQLDVTRRRDAEDALRQSQKMEAVGQLTGGIAHDFNNLLQVIQGYGDVLQANIESETFNKARATRAISAILQASSKGSTLTGQLLAFARKQKLQGRIVSLADLVEHTLPLVERSVGDGIEITVSHKQSCNTRIDPVQAEMALLNVAVNARDGMQGKGKLSIVTECVTIDSEDTIFGSVEYGDYSVLSVADNGSGIDPDTLDRITEPFFTTKGEGRGTGLGLSMVDGFVKQSGGYLKILSEVGFGTTVYMLFKCEKHAVEPETAKAQKLVEGRKGEAETILLVEDKNEVADLVEDILLEFGYTVLRAENADAAIRIAKHHDEIDLLFSDIVMPGMNGVMLARQIRSDYPDIKILLTTGFTDNKIDISDQNGKPFELIKKPYKRLELVDRIRFVIDGPDGIS